MLNHVNYFLSFFHEPSAWGIGLAIGFGAVWLACYWPSLTRRPWLWAVLVGTAFLTLAALCFIQIPLQNETARALSHLWSSDTLMRWILLAYIPIILLSGLVQEGAKLVLVVVYWWRKGKEYRPQAGTHCGCSGGCRIRHLGGTVGAQRCLRAGSDLGNSPGGRLHGTAAILGEVLCRSQSHRIFRARWLWSGQRLGLAVLLDSFRTACRTKLQRGLVPNGAPCASSYGNLCRRGGSGSDRLGSVAALEKNGRSA